MVKGKEEPSQRHLQLIQQLIKFKKYPISLNTLMSILDVTDYKEKIKIAFSVDTSTLPISDVLFLAGLLNVSEQVQDEFEYEGKKFKFILNPSVLTVQQYADIEFVLGNYEGKDRFIPLCSMLTTINDEPYNGIHRIERVEEFSNFPAVMFWGNFNFFCKAFQLSALITLLSIQIQEVTEMLKGEITRPIDTGTLLINTHHSIN